MLRAAALYQKFSLLSKGVAPKNGKKKATKITEVKNLIKRLFPSHFLDTLGLFTWSEGKCDIPPEGGAR